MFAPLVKENGPLPMLKSTACCGSLLAACRFFAGKKKVSTALLDSRLTEQRRRSIIGRVSTVLSGLAFACPRNGDGRECGPTPSTG